MPAITQTHLLKTRTTTDDGSAVLVFWCGRSAYADQMTSHAYIPPSKQLPGCRDCHRAATFATCTEPGSHAR